MLLFLSFIGGFGIGVLITTLCTISNISEMEEELYHERKVNIKLEKLLMDLRKGE